jgi:predicted metal-dependent peptidase
MSLRVGDISADAAQRMKRARAGLVMRQPFFGTLALHLRLEESARFKTMATDGKSLAYSPEWVMGLDASELEGVIAHEVLHCANKHHTRRQRRDAKLWNQATDYAINRDLKAAGFRLPACGLFDKRFDGLGAEAIYRQLEDDQKQQQQQGGGQPQPGGGQPQPGQGGQGQPGQQQGQPGQGQPGQGDGGSDPGGCGEILDAAPGHDEAANTAAAAEWDMRTRQAAAVAKARGAGKLPGELAQLVEAINKPRIDWRAVLRRFVDESASRDFSWMRPNRRHIAAGRIMPGYVPDRPSHVVAMVDTSASIDARDLADFAAEIQAALDEGAADRVTVAYADTKVHRSESFDAGDVITMKAQGRGGTSFRQPFEWLAETIPDASAVLYMTDCDVTEWGEQPAAPVLWIVTGDPRKARAHSDRAPFGEAIVLQE